MKIFNYIIILIFICNFIQLQLGIKSLLFILALSLCIFFILFFKSNFKNFKYENIHNMLIILKKIINLTSVLTLFFSFSPNWMSCIDYVVEAGLEDKEDVHKAVNELGLTENQKYYLKIGCIITGVVLSVVFGYYIIKNYEIFKPDDKNLDNLDFKDLKIINDIKEETLVDNIKHDIDINEDEYELLDVIFDEIFKDNQKKPINDDLSDTDVGLNSYVNFDFDKWLFHNLDGKDHANALKVEKLWESLVHFRNTHPGIIKIVLKEEITSENIQYYETFKYHYDIYLDYYNKGNSLLSPVHPQLISNMVDAYLKIPEVAKAMKKY